LFLNRLISSGIGFDLLLQFLCAPFAFGDLLFAHLLRKLDTIAAGIIVIIARQIKKGVGFDNVLIDARTNFVSQT